MVTCADNLSEQYKVQSSAFDSTVSQAYFGLHKTLHKLQNFKEKIFFTTKDTSEAFLSISQNLKVKRLQGGTQKKLRTCWQNFDLQGHLIVFFWGGGGLVHGFAVLQ